MRGLRAVKAIKTGNVWDGHVRVRSSLMCRRRRLITSLIQGLCRWSNITCPTNFPLGDELLLCDRGIFPHLLVSSNLSTHLSSSNLVFSSSPPSSVARKLANLGLHVMCVNSCLGSVHPSQQPQNRLSRQQCNKNRKWHSSDVAVQLASLVACICSQWCWLLAATADCLFVQTSAIFKEKGTASCAILP